LKGPRVAPVLLLALAVALLGPPPAAAGIADRVAATFALMANDFVAAFKPVEGLVVSAEGREIFLDVTEAAGAQVGQEYTIFRKGEPFLHPLTGKTLGYYETVLGYAQVIRVYPNFVAATFIAAPDAPSPRAGDGGRITRARIRVAVAPMLDLTTAHADLRRVPFLLAAALEGSKRFLAVDPLSVSDMFASGGVKVEEMLARPERAVRAARNLDVGGWVISMLIERRGVTYLDVTYVSAVTGNALFSRRLPLVAPNATEDQRFPWEPRPED
jgi:hypothetical protein